MGFPIRKPYYHQFKVISNATDYYFTPISVSIQKLSFEILFCRELVFETLEVVCCEKKLSLPRL